jgi:hypothetical protein
MGLHHGAEQCASVAKLECIMNPFGEPVPLERRLRNELRPTLSRLATPQIAEISL